MPGSPCYEDCLVGVQTAFISGYLDKHLQSEAAEKADYKAEGCRAVSDMSFHLDFLL